MSKTEFETLAQEIDDILSEITDRKNYEYLEDSTLALNIIRSDLLDDNAKEFIQTWRRVIFETKNNNNFSFCVSCYTFCSRGKLVYP